MTRQAPPYHGRDHRPAGWTDASDPGGADPMDWLTNGLYVDSFVPELIVFGPSNTTAWSQYWHYPGFVAYWGSIHFDTGFDFTASTLWYVTLPIPATYLSTAQQIIGGAFLIDDDVVTPSSMELMCGIVLDPAPTTYLRFWFQDAYPIGNWNEFKRGNTGGWTPSVGDTLAWYCIYPTAMDA